VPDQAVLVVRGDELDPEVIRVDASNFHDRFRDWNRYGVSAFLAADDSEVDALCAARLIRFSTVVTFRVADLVAVGVEVVPTFRTPHVTLCHVELEALIDSLRSCEHQTRPNPYHEG
jgi:hypothetical protein